VSSIHQIDFLGVDAILSKTFNQNCDEIYGAEMTFLSKSERVYVNTLEILMTRGKGKAREQYGKPTRQDEVWGLVVILRRGGWNELTGHPKDRGKNRSNSRANSLQPGEDDVDQTTYLTF
jgi:hypothetical protein